MHIAAQPSTVQLNSRVVPRSKQARPTQVSAMGLLSLGHLLLAALFVLNSLAILNGPRCGAPCAVLVCHNTLLAPHGWWWPVHPCMGSLLPSRHLVAGAAVHRLCMFYLPFSANSFLRKFGLDGDDMLPSSNPMQVCKMVPLWSNWMSLARV